MISSSQKRAKAREKQAKAENKKAGLNKYFNRTTQTRN